MVKKSSLEVELELVKIDNQFLKQRKIISLKEANNLFLKSKKELESLEGKPSEKIKEEAMKIFLKMVGLTGKFSEEWEKGKFSPTDEELDIMEKITDDSEIIADNEYIEYGKSAKIDKEAVTMIRNKMKELEAKVQAEKARRKNSPDNNGGNNNNGGDNNGNKNGNNNSNDTKQKITNLQNQINILEEKLRKQPNSGSNSEDKKKLERLKTEIETLKEKQKDKSQNENNGPKDNFPYGLVIGGGIVISLLLIAVIFFWQRSRKR